MGQRLMFAWLALMSATPVFSATVSVKESPVVPLIWTNPAIATRSEWVDTEVSPTPSTPVNVEPAPAAVATPTDGPSSLSLLAIGLLLTGIVRRKSVRSLWI